MNNKHDKGQNEKRKKWAVTIVSAVLLSLLYMVIFSFSAQDSAESGSLSYAITEKCVELVNHLTGKHWTEQMIADFTAYFEHPIRKFAHFSEYAAMGFLVSSMLGPWTSRKRRLFCIAVLWVFASAAADEFHQLFVPGRYGCFADVCLDTLGGICGFFAWRLIAHIYRVAFRS